MQNRNKESGYTLIETLVALTLLFVLLFLVTELMPLISNKASNELKLKAITACRNQMEVTLATKNYTELTQNLEKKLVLKQIIEDKKDKILITISVYLQNSDRTLYKLTAYIDKNEKQTIIGN